MRKVNWDSVIDNVQAGLVWFVIGIVTSCTAVLILFDVLAGTGVMYYLTNGKTDVAAIISMATTGLLMALMFIAYTLIEKKDKTAVAVGWAMLIASFCVFCLDVMFDAYTADVLRFGQIMVLKDIPNSMVHLLFRVLLGGLSCVGEGLAVSIIVGMPVLKKLINNALPVSRQSTQPMKPYNQSAMSSLPRANTPSTAQRNHPAPRPQPQTHRPEPTYHPVSHRTPPMPEAPDFDDDMGEDFRHATAVN